ncbi:hypothetical protein [Streptomyces liliifuscus]|uniref:Uncharacterized protein n=1 Tax=Streptomyces liliifuscus TaxID=2797636 RepID=A0A7T7L272_9ACTN|nr:hypothetical protein [Streptomyces liliifuscus]QQM44981.1 hypothetical protein JEQ17_39990 [Streptomyces liliifuscus]
MAEQLARPTPLNVAARAPRLIAEPPRREVAEQRLAARPLFDRHTWEQAIRYSELHPYSRLLAMMLAHYADGTGHIPSSDVLVAPRLAKACNVPVQDVHISLSVLYRERYIDRGEPSGHTPRSVTLSFPPGYQRPHSPGDRP